MVLMEQPVNLFTSNHLMKMTKGNYGKQRVFAPVLHSLLLTSNIPLELLFSLEGRIVFMVLNATKFTYLL